MNHNYSIVHGIAECSTCGWKTQSYKNAQANAARHARVHGHKVLGELGIAFGYDGSDKKKPDGEGK